MSTSTNYSSKYDIKNEITLRTKLEKSGFNFSALDYAFWKATGKNVTVSLYKSGKILVQGQGTESFVQDFLNGSGQLNLNIGSAKISEKSSKLQHSFTCWVGTDESGKGDYLGPLVVAGVLVDEKNRKILEDSGIKDSKKMNEASIIKAAQIIRKSSVFSVVVIGPQKYNELYEKFKNLNKLLAWGHARVIENIMEKTPCDNAISDKFGDESLIKNALMKKGRTINLVQEIKAENDIAVAAASVVAREEFVRRMKNLETQYGMSFPKGASDRVVEQANLFVKKYGKAKLSEVAKLHFKTTQQIIN